MNKSFIASIDKGFYQEAKTKGIHALDYLTQQVKAEPPEIQKVADRLGRRFPACLMEPGAPLEQHVNAWAHRVAGLTKCLEVAGIRGNDTVEKAFFSSSNASGTQGLFPAYLATQIIAGQMAVSLVPRLVAGDISIMSHVQEKVTISDSKETRTLKFIGEGADLPKTKISRTSGSISLYKYGRMMEATYESIRLMHLNLLGLQLQRMGRQIGIDQTDDLIETCVAGDGTSGSAVTDTDAEVSGTLDYDELIRLFFSFDIGYEMRHAVTNDTQLRTILNMAEFKDPQAGFSFQRTGVLPGPMGANWHRWNSTGAASFSTDRILAVDDRSAIVLYREGDLLEEADRLIDKQLEQRTMSEWIGFMKWDNEATQCLDITT
jgi:hypothetical protein